VIDKILFIPLIFFSSYLLKITGVLKKEHSEIFVNYVIYFALPALTFDLAREMELSGPSMGVVLSAWGIIGAGIALSSIVGKALKLPSRTLRSFILVSSFGNTAFLGYPYALAYFGEKGFLYAVLYDQLGSFLAVITLGFLIALGKINIKEIVTFPPLLALIAGFVLRDLALPEWFERFLDISGSSLIPTVLFALGLSFSFGDLKKSLWLSFVVVSIKMLILPVLLGIFFFATGLTGEAFRVALLQSSMPPMVMAGVLAIRYGLDSGVAVSSIALGILASFFTTGIIMTVFR
jgi:predicted permease